MHDAFLLQPAAPSYVDARDAMLAADLMRFTDDADFGNHQDILWLEFARRGLGFNASSAGSNDLDPTADFSLPPSHSLDNAEIDFVVQAVDEGNAPVTADIYVGHYEARANPIATSASGPVSIAPGTYDLLAVAPGYGHLRFTQTFEAGDARDANVFMPTNFASAVKGASASGDGADHGELIDDTESTSWDFTGQVGITPQVVTIDLGVARTINRVQVSALAENGGNRFVQLRQFEVQACLAGIIEDCAGPTGYTSIFTSGADAFDGQPIRPLAPNLLIQSFEVTPITATHLRFVALHNQCTGSSEFIRDDWAPGAVEPTDCREGITIVGTTGPVQTERDDEMHAAEFQAFASAGSVDSDLDEIPDAEDNCPTTPNADQADADGDGVGDVCDNCTAEANPTQCDTNGEGFGNHCDADLDNNNIVNQIDLGILRNELGESGENDADLDCNGIVNQIDLGRLRDDLGQSPGPSAFAP
jgi:hypothetical protein